MFSSGRWRRGWCASVTKSLSSNHALKQLLPTLCLVVVVIYGLADKLRNFVTGIFIPQYHYPYSVALCFAQVGVWQCTLSSKWISQKWKYWSLAVHFINCGKKWHLCTLWLGLFGLHSVVCVCWQQGICLCCNYMCLNSASAHTQAKVVQHLICSCFILCVCLFKGESVWWC